MWLCSFYVIWGVSVGGCDGTDGIKPNRFFMTTRAPALPKIQFWKKQLKICNVLQNEWHFPWEFMLKIRNIACKNMLTKATSIIWEQVLEVSLLIMKCEEKWSFVKSTKNIFAVAVRFQSQGSSILNQDFEKRVLCFIFLWSIITLLSSWWSS